MLSLERTLKSLPNFYGRVGRKNKPAFWGLALSSVPPILAAGLLFVNSLLANQRGDDDYFLFFLSPLIFWSLLALGIIVLISASCAFVLSLMGLIKTRKGAPLRVMALLGLVISSLVLFYMYLLASLF